MKALIYPRIKYWKLTKKPVYIRFAQRFDKESILPNGLYLAGQDFEKALEEWAVKYLTSYYGCLVKIHLRHGKSKDKQDIYMLAENASYADKWIHLEGTYDYEEI